MRLQTYIIACLAAALSMGLCIGVAKDMLWSYNVSYVDLTNDTDIGRILSNTSILPQVQNETMTAASYAPGQPNSQQLSGTNPSGSIQLSSFASVLKFIDLAISYPKLFIITVGSFYGFPPALLETISTILYVIIILFIAGIVFFRPF